MMKLRLFSLSVCLIVIASVHADSIAVLTGNTGDTVQYQYIVGRINKNFDLRRSELNETLKSKVQMFKRRDELRKWFASEVGPMPQTPLNPKVHGVIDCAGYTIEKISFESEPNHHVTGLLYIPKTGLKSYPATLITSGHSYEGKGSSAYQQAARLYALNGIIAFQVDPISQGERLQYLDSSGKPLTREGTYMHENLGHGMMLTGTNTMVRGIVDNVRALDYLCRHPLVDKERLAVAGNSGGGTQVVFLAAYDRRIKVATPSCFVATTEFKFNEIGAQDGCQHLWGEGKMKVEEADFLLMAYPAAIRIISAEEDFFSIHGARKAYKDLKEMYTTLGKPTKADHAVKPGKHGWHQPLREASVQWAKQWLLNDPAEVIEPKEIGYLSKPEEYNVTAAGLGLTFFPGELSVVDLNKKRAKVCSVNRAAFLKRTSGRALEDSIKQIIGYEEPALSPRATSVGVIDKGSYVVEKWLVERDRESGFRLPTLIYRPKNHNREMAAMVLISEAGKNDPRFKATIDSAMKAGTLVMAVDVCNTGELRDSRRKDVANCEFYIAKLALYEGRSLMVYRTEDVILATRFLLNNNKINKKAVTLVSMGFTTPAAWHAAALSNYFVKVKTIGGLESWESMAGNYVTENQAGNVVPRVLNYYDLPNLKPLIDR